MKRPSPEMLISFYHAALAAPPGTCGTIKHDVSTPDRKVRRTK
jgi:hypothetical protein